MSKHLKLEYSLPRFMAIIKENGKEVCRRQSYSKMKVYNFSERNFFKGRKIVLRVTYKPGIKNWGVYDNWEDFLLAWRSFTADKFIKDVIKNY